MVVSDLAVPSRTTSSPVSPGNRKPFDVLLVLGIPLSLMTGLRSEALPIGPGELLLAAWMVIAIGHWIFRRAGAPISKATRSELRPFVWFWSLSLPLLCVATLWSVLAQLSDPPERYRDLVAYTLIFLLTICLALRNYSASAFVWIYGRTLAIYASASLAALLFLIGTGEYLLGIQFYDRFTALSLNPNQPGFLLTAAPFIAVHFALQARRPINGLSWLFVAIAAISVGVATQSDGLVLAWLLGVGTLITQTAATFVGGRHSDGLLRLAPWLVVTVIACLLALALLTLGDATTSRLVAMIAGSWDGADARFEVWTNAVSQIGESPIIGLGVGAHAYDRYGVMEAHNSLIEWTLQTGLLGLLLVLILLVGTFRRVIASRRAWLLAALVAVMGGTLTNSPLRHPAFWLNLLSIAVLAHVSQERRRRPAWEVRQ